MKLLSAAVLVLVVLPLVCSAVVAEEKGCPKDKDINQCSSISLTHVKGIGAKTAQKIIDGRPYASINDITRVKGIGEKTKQRFVDAGFCVGAKK